MIGKELTPILRAGVRIVAAIDSSPGAARVAEVARYLSDAFDCDWEAVHIECPSNAGLSQEVVADALGLAASLGAVIATLPADSVAVGLVSHVEAAAVDHLVMGQSSSSKSLFRRRTLIDEINGQIPGVTLHLVPIGNETVPAKPQSVERSSPADYGYALLAAALTIGVVFALKRAAGFQNLSFAFFLPVIAAAARLGTKPAVVAAAACAAAFNLLFLDPELTLKPGAIQSWIMLASLILTAIYTGRITANLRARALLSERNARENASIATFVAELTRAADWPTSAEVICSSVGTLLNAHTILVREVDGSLKTVASAPPGITLDPLDKTALDWAWAHNEPAGFGTEALSAANWRFEPLATSLGTLAVLALARTDGRDPVPATRKLMLSTLLAQSALALERLRLEDLMKAQTTPADGRLPSKMNN